MNQNAGLGPFSYEFGLRVFARSAWLRFHQQRQEQLLQQQNHALRSHAMSLRSDSIDANGLSVEDSIAGSNVSRHLPGQSVGQFLCPHSIPCSLSFSILKS
jgi:hypothetical protein